MASRRTRSPRSRSLAADRAVTKATGRDYRQWRDLLALKGGTSLRHEARVAILCGAFGLSKWWASRIAADFERATLRGRP